MPRLWRNCGDRSVFSGKGYQALGVPKGFTEYSELLFQNQPKLIRTEAANERTLAIVEDLMRCFDCSPEERELYDLLIVLTEKFEQEFYQPSFSSNPRSMLI